MSRAMDRLPDELLLQVFDVLTFNQLRPALATCARWRALAQQSRAFWADIQTPATPAASRTTEGSLEAASELVCYRIASTNGRGFTLRLCGTLPNVLAAAAEHINHIEHLDVRLTQFDNPGALLEILGTVSAPQLITLSIRLEPTEDEPLSRLPDDLFSGAACPLLTRVYLSEVILSASDPLPCFACATDVRYWHSTNFVAPAAPDVFAHFPSARTFSISGYMREVPGLRDEQMDIIGRLQSADLSRVVHLDIHSECWELANNTHWPMQPIPHISVDWRLCKEFPALPSKLRGAHELVIEAPAGTRDESLIRLGTEDWSFSRSSTAGCFFGHSLVGLNLVGGLAFEFSIQRAIGSAIRTASLPASLWSVSLSTLHEAPNIKTLRLILDGRRDVLPRSFAGELRVRLRSAKLETLILRGAYDAAGPVRIEYGDLVRFAAADLPESAFPLHLRLENVELSGPPSDDFATYFSDVQAQDPAEWRYLAVREMLNKADHWPGL